MEEQNEKLKNPLTQWGLILGIVVTLCGILFIFSNDKYLNLNQANIEGKDAKSKQLLMREKELDPELKYADKDLLTLPEMAEYLGISSAEKFKDIIIDSEGEPNAMPRQQIDGVYYISKKELDAWFGD